MHILVECFVDTLFIELLGYQCNSDHSNIGNVAKRMKHKFAGEKVLGIADNDPTLPLYFDEFIETKLGHSHCVKFYKHKSSKDRFLILIDHDIEELIMRIEQETKSKPFTKTRSKLEEITKNHSVRDNKRFVQHLNNIMRKNPPSIAFLRKCITEAAKAK